jgi:valyl-tRNA synthetase
MSARRGLGRLVALLAVVSSSACVSVSPPHFLQVPSDREWKPTLDRAREMAARGQIEQADSLLAQFATAYPTAPQAVEAGYWRAILNLRSPAATQGISRAIPLLRTYVAAGPSTEHWTEADALLRAAARVDTLSHVAATYVSRGEVATDAAAQDKIKADNTRAAETKVVAADTKAQDDEIKRLKDELAKSKEELERIKKRLAEPPKKPPR